MEAIQPLKFTVRPWRPADDAVCRALYREGFLGGFTAENDTGADIDDIQMAYMDAPNSCFWVAEIGTGEVVGMIGVQQYEAGVGEIRRLRVRPDHRRRGIGSKLLETAIQFCHDHGNVKIALDTFIDREPAIKLFEKFHFRHQRTKQVAGKELLYFYLDIYGHDRKGDS